MQEAFQKSEEMEGLLSATGETSDKKEVGVLADAHLSITRNALCCYSRCFVLAIIWSCTSLCISVK
jgi:hypothetical protein